MSAQPAVASSSSNFKTILPVIGSCAIGGSVGYLCVKLLITQFHLSAKSITSADAVALWLGIAFLGAGAMLAFVSTNRTMLARSMEGEGVELPATDEEVRISRLQAAVLALAGVMLLTPIFAPQGQFASRFRGAGLFRYRRALRRADGAQCSTVAGRR
jgi:hypothetical protein